MNLCAPMTAIPLVSGPDDDDDDDGGGGDDDDDDW